MEDECTTINNCLVWTNNNIIFLGIVTTSPKKLNLHRHGQHGNKCNHQMKRSEQIISSCQSGSSLRVQTLSVESIESIYNNWCFFSFHDILNMFFSPFTHNHFQMLSAYMRIQGHMFIFSFQWIFMVSKLNSRTNPLPCRSATCIFHQRCLSEGGPR